MRNKEDHPRFWENIYLANNAGWDLNGPTPIFESLADSLHRGKICIIGCGKGHDAVMFAEKGFEITAVDFAPSAIAAVRQLSKERNVAIETLQTDIFHLVKNCASAFDYVIEQTCFCAINPSRRQEYERTIYDILKPDGCLIGLWFPLDKTFDMSGPPWGTTVDEVKSIFEERWEVEREEWPNLSIGPRKGREKLIIFRKIV